MADWSSSDSRFKVTGPTLENRSMVDVVSSHVALKTGAKMLLIRLAMPLNDIFCSLRKPPCSSAQLGMFPTKCRKQSLKPLCRDSQWNIRKDDTEKKFWCLYNDLFCTHIFQLITGTEMYLHSTGKYLFQEIRGMFWFFLCTWPCVGILFLKKEKPIQTYISLELWTRNKKRYVSNGSGSQSRRYTDRGARAECSRVKTGARRQATSHHLKLLMKLQGPSSLPEQDQPWRLCTL